MLLSFDYNQLFNQLLLSYRRTSSSSLDMQHKKYQYYFRFIIEFDGDDRLQSTLK